MEEKDNELKKEEELEEELEEEQDEHERFVRDPWDTWERVKRKEHYTIPVDSVETDETKFKREEYFRNLRRR